MNASPQFDFLRRHGARRMRPYGDQPVLEPSGDRGAGEGDADADGEPGHGVDRGLEQAPDDWSPVDTRGGAAPDEDDRPRRFVDGSHVHQTVAWVRDPDGHPVPVELAEIGGVCMRAEGRRLVRECDVVERVVCMALDPYPWHEVESFAAALADAGLRLLAARPPEDEAGRPAMSFDFEQMRNLTRNACRHAMGVLEEVAWGRNSDLPTLVDGRLTRFHHRRVERSNVVGVIKRQHADYLHEQGWRTLYALEPGQRTPAFRLSVRNLEVVSWYLKLDGAHGAMPNWGIVRIEIPAARFDETGGDYALIDRLSRGLLDLRCRRHGYGRGPVSLEPIVRAEESLKSLFTPLPPLVEHFYRIVGL